MIRLHDVFEIPELGLTPVVTPTGASPEIRWAHVSELVDPSPWLLGKELLLTTGFALKDSATAWDEYCSRVASAQVSVVGMSTGPSLPYPSIPKGLIAAAEKHGLALIHVPHDTLMQSVVQKVSDALYHAANQDLVRSFSVQRQLSEAASSAGGPDRIVEVLNRVLGFQTVVLDERLRVLAKSSAAAEERVTPIRDELRARLREGLRWSISMEGQEDSLVVLPLGTEGRLSGILTRSKPSALSVHDRAALGLAASLLGILLERRMASQKHRRMLESQLLNGLLADSSTVTDVQRYLAQHGVEATHIEVLSTGLPSDEADYDQFIAEVLELCDEVLVTRMPDGCIFALINAHGPLADPLRELVQQLRLGHSGLGERRPLLGIAESLSQARFARTVAISRDVPLLERADTGGYRALMQMGDPEARHRFADEVLAPLDEADRSGRGELVKTVRAYLTALGNHEATAEALGVHRHTVRARVTRIMELTGRNLANPEDFLELWLAIECRTSDVGEPEAAADRSPSTSSNR
ncbi:PucR family transcriptional regulator [Leucobacter sp. CSA2]|uniref:PucR family transcriptional regulator n=1 Tax=Leucobacter edaphi TaxID=2796472 RepID=A0A934QC46_9MICO|nr:PucR family transcriptional regulator [Leucobacter edaphi]MBK0421931.1 PucR family transcriptional regulator [Leucobacter edaphi]